MKSTKNSVLIASLLLNLFFLKCSLDKDETLKMTVAGHYDTLLSMEQKFATEKNKLDHRVAIQRAELVSYSDRVNALLKENTKLKGEISTQIKANKRLEVINKELKADLTPKIEKDTVYFYAGTRFDIDDPCFSMKSKLTNTGLGIESLQSETDAVVTINRKNQISLSLSNPCISVTSLASVHQQEKKKWHDNRWFWLGVGALFGASVNAAGIYIVSKQ